MTLALILLAVLLVALAALAQRHPQRPHGPAARRAWREARPLLLRLPLALLAASILAALIPAPVVAAWLGDAAGLRGIMAATAVGAVLPGGPMVAFPIALGLWEAGAGYAQMVTLITAWSVIAVHRLLVFEWPMLGARFALLRLAASVLLPPLAGAGTLGILWVLQTGGLRLYA